jgi:hypothetical protein
VLLALVPDLVDLPGLSRMMPLEDWSGSTYDRGKEHRLTDRLCTDLDLSRLGGPMGARSSEVLRGWYWADAQVHVVLEVMVCDCSESARWRESRERQSALIWEERGTSGLPAPTGWLRHLTDRNGSAVLWTAGLSVVRAAANITRTAKRENRALPAPAPLPEALLRMTLLRLARKLEVSGLQSVQVPVRVNGSQVTEKALAVGDMAFIAVEPFARATGRRYAWSRDRRELTLGGMGQPAAVVKLRAFEATPVSGETVRLRWQLVTEDGRPIMCVADLARVLGGRAETATDGSINVMLP